MKKQHNPKSQRKTSLMFDRDLWREIFQSIQKNKLRSILSGFTISFAILIFTLLFGIANGLQNTFESFFVKDASNAIFIRTGKTSKPYKGNQTGKRIQLANEDFDFLKIKNEAKIEHASGRIFKNFNVAYKSNRNNYNIRAVHPAHQFIEKSLMTRGRYINLADLQNTRKVAVIGKMVSDDLFQNKPAVGKYIQMQGIAFQIVGVFEEASDDNENRMIYIPINTAQSIYEKNDEINEINLTYNPSMNYEEALDFGYLLKKQLQQRLTVAPTDQRAIRIQNNAEGKKGIDQMMFVIGILILFIGFGTLIAGIVGISNIMIYIVKERTKELGIRKVLGASPRAIVSLILLEAISITSLAGYLGIFIGMGALNFIDDKLEAYFVKDPHVDTPLLIAAVIVLIVAGCIAGYMPAKRASKIKPIVALRAE
jgi:putative ABC transport system permease protein